MRVPYGGEQLTTFLLFSFLLCGKTAGSLEEKSSNFSPFLFQAAKSSATEEKRRKVGAFLLQAAKSSPTEEKRRKGEKLEIFHVLIAETCLKI